MNKLLLPLCTLLSLGGYGQVAFQDISFTEALKRSYSESKIIFLQMESDECTQCNEVADKGLSDKEVGKRVNATFLPLKISAAHPDRAEIMERYNLENRFGTFFIDHNGVLLHRFPRTTSRSQDYLTEIDVALNHAGEALKVDELEREFRNDNRSPGFLESLLLKKRSLGLPTDALLDEYVALLPADSLRSPYTLTFIASMAPLLDSKSYQALRRDPQGFHTAWMTMPLAQRVAINRTIIARSMDAAIALKSEGRARCVAAFCSGTYGPDKTGAERGYTTQMLRYYERTGDTARYLSEALRYYDRFYMTLSVDSIRGIDAQRRRELLDKTPKRDSLLPNGTLRRYATIAYAPIVQRFSAELNNGAWNVYKRTGDAERLRTALQWSERSLQFYESPEALDTYARLLYTLGDRARAVETEEKSLRLRKERGYPTSSQEAALQRMKANRPLAD